MATSAPVALVEALRDVQRDFKAMLTEGYSVAAAIIETDAIGTDFHGGCDPLPGKVRRHLFGYFGAGPDGGPAKETTQIYLCWTAAQAKRWGVDSGGELARGPAVVRLEAAAERAGRLVRSVPWPGLAADPILRHASEPGLRGWVVYVFVIAWARLPDKCPKQVWFHNFTEPLTRYNATDHREIREQQRTSPRIDLTGLNGGRHLVGGALAGLPWPAPEWFAACELVSTSIMVIDELVRFVNEKPGGRDPEHPCRHSEDYRSVVWYGKKYTFTYNQAAVVRILWENCKKGTPEVATATLLESADSIGGRLDTVFEKGKHPAWNAMIVRGSRKGTRKLAAPEENQKKA